MISKRLLLLILLISLICQAVADNEDDAAVLEKLGEKAKKVAQKRRKADTKLVDKVFKQSMKGHHYAVLGIRNVEIKLKFGPKVVTLRKITPDFIKKAYRKRARQLHPDKNTDSRATQAFHKLEASFQILSNEESRSAYDQEIAEENKAKREKMYRTMNNMQKKVMVVVNPLRKTLNTFVRPFSTPLFVLGALII